MSLIDKSIFEEVYQYVIRHVAKESGNVFSDKNKTMVESRISKRILTLDLGSMNEYLDYIKQNQEEEFKHLVGLLTTHHTFFFREIVHFEFLESQLEEIVKRVRDQGRDTINIWSAACSKGQEVYSLATFFEKKLKKIDPQMNYRVFGSDIDHDSVEFSKKGIYRYNEIKQIPNIYLKGFWGRGKGSNDQHVKIAPRISKKCEFKYGNLLEIPSEFHGQFDIIFCRNVLIYFETPNVKKISQNLLKCLTPGGLFFTGVSEPIGDIVPNVHKIGACVYMRQEDVQKIETPVIVKEEKTEKIRVVIVDDSKPVLKILEKMFQMNDRFEVVGKCTDGQELVEFFKQNEADVVTLDLHMPNMDGVSYLRDHYKEGHPPVIVVSSVNKDNETLGKKAVEYGALDYVEKPTLQNLDKSSEEITNKIIVAHNERKQEQTQPEKEQAKTASSHDEDPSGAELKRTEPVLRQKSLYYKDDVGVSKEILKIDLFVFVDQNDAKNLKRFLHELHDLGYFPKGIITNRDTNWVKKELKEFEFKFSQLKKRKDEEILLTNVNDFLMNHSQNMNYHNQILTFFKGSNMTEFLPKKYTVHNYLLADQKDTNDLGNFHAMPSPSWAFHVEEKFQEYLLPRNEFVPIKKIAKYGQYVHKNEGLIGVYEKDTKQLQGVVVVKNLSKNLREVLPAGKGFELRFVGGSLLTKSLMSLVPNECEVSKVILRNNTFRYGVTPSKIVVGKRAVSFKVKGHLDIKVEEAAVDERKKILVVDDSKVFGKILRNIIDKSEYVCSNILTDPLTLKSELEREKPDVITLDVNMPGMSGVEAFKNVIKEYNIPTIVISSSVAESREVVELLSMGAVDYINKPSQGDLKQGNFPLIEKIEIALRANVTQVAKGSRISSLSMSSIDDCENTIITIGSSTGGTRAILELLKSFPDKFPPVVIAQHIPEHFSASFAEHLNNEFAFTVKEAEDNEVIQSNCVYIARGGYNLELHQTKSDVKLKITSATSAHTFIPNVNELFYSAARLKEFNLVGLILTGMGKDGAVGIGKIKDYGGYTVAQDESTCTIYGMPKAAVEGGFVHKELPLYNIAKDVFQHLNKVQRKTKIDQAS